jgi:hypothetical protein
LDNIVSIPISSRHFRVSFQRIRAASISPFVARMKRKGIVDGDFGILVGEDGRFGVVVVKDLDLLFEIVSTVLFVDNDVDVDVDDDSDDDDAAVGVDAGDLGVSVLIETILLFLAFGVGVVSSGGSSENVF